MSSDLKSNDKPAVELPQNDWDVNAGSPLADTANLSDVPEAQPRKWANPYSATMRMNKDEINRQLVIMEEKRRIEAERGDPTILRCNNCGNIYASGQSICSHCGIVFSTNLGKTNQIDNNDEIEPRRDGNISGESMVDARPLFFEIEGQVRKLPDGQVLIIGRSSGVMNDAQPNIPLNEFGAETKGVSRRHVRIRRHEPLVYISDLHSTNGTFLNGFRLNPDEERILRDGDELHLSRLAIKIRFGQ